MLAEVIVDDPVVAVEVTAVPEHEHSSEIEYTCRQDHSIALFRYTQNDLDRQIPCLMFLMKMSIRSCDSHSNRSRLPLLRYWHQQIDAENFSYLRNGSSNLVKETHLLWIHWPPHWQ